MNYDFCFDYGVYCWFNALTDQTKDFEIDICCFSTKHVTVRSKSKDWLTRHQDNVSEWSNMSNHRLLFQWTSTIKIQLRVFLVPRWHHYHLIKCNLFSHDILLAKQFLIWYNHFSTPKVKDKLQSSTGWLYSMSTIYSLAFDLSHIGLWCLMPLLPIYQLYLGGQF